MRPPRTASGKGQRLRVAAAITLAALCCFAAVAFAEPGSAEVKTTTNAPDPAPAGQDSGPTSSALNGPFVDQADDPPSRTPVITATAPDQVTAGSEATITVKVTNVNAAGEIAYLEQRDGDTWDATSSNAVTSENTAELKVAQTDPAAYGYRVRLSATTQHDEAVSDGITINVVPTADPTPPPPTDPPPADPGPGCGADAPLKADGTPWVCTYDDEFSGSTLNRKYWVPQLSATSNVYSGTASSPACFIDDPRTIDVSNGDLVLGAKYVDTPVKCGAKTSNEISGMVSHNGTFSQTYGRYEVRAKVPSFSGKGLQETLWLWPNDALKYGYAHPASGEIDFAEFYSNYVNLNIPVDHYLFDPSTINFTTNTNVYTAWNCPINVGQYNTYAVEWSPGLITIFINGTVCLTDNYKAYNATPDHPYAPFDQPFFLALTQAFGTTGNEFDPATGPKDSETRVDYVRVWK
jgi:hypothetical protein